MHEAAPLAPERHQCRASGISFSLFYGASSLTARLLSDLLLPSPLSPLPSPLSPPPSLSATPAGLRVEHARLGDGEAAQDDPLLLAHAHAVAALVSAMPHTPFGAPQALTTATLNAASDLAASPSEAQRRAAWVVLTAMMRLDPDWLGSKARLSKLFGLWKGVLAARVEVSPGGAKAANVEKELRCRAHCLQCVTCFLQSLPEAFTTPLLKPIVNTLLPPNSALLAAVKEGANGLQKELGAGFRPAYVLFRARLYELLIILPSSQLTAKLLNVVMPLVVHDLVDPSSTGAPLCPALVPQLNADDARLGASADDERSSEPTRDALSELMASSCDSFAELRPNGAVAATAESSALSAAVRLFASVFRLQTSDVRAQLLGHLGTAAAKAAEKAAKEARSSGGMPSMAGLPGGVGGFLGAATGSGGSSAKDSNLSSALANVSAALLGSLTTLRNKPSKSPLSASLEGPIDSVIVPCLSDADPAVRRAAAQCVHLTAELLGASYAARFVATARGKLSDAKARAEAKAGFALALGWLGRANAAAADDPANAPVGGGCGVPLKQLVAALGDAAGDANGGLACEWATHGLASIAHAASLGHVPPAEFRKEAMGFLGVSSSLLLSEPPPSHHTVQAIARLSAMIVAALSSDEAVHHAAASGGKVAATLATTVNRCAVINAAACALAPPPALPSLQAEALQFACVTLQLPQSLLGKSTLDARAELLPMAILEGLKSRHTPLRRAAIATQRSLGELAAAAAAAAAETVTDPAAPLPSPEGGVAAVRGGRERLVNALFEAIEYEPTEEAMEEAKLLLLSQLHVTAESDPAFWLKALRAIVLEIKKPRGGGGGELGGGGGGGGGGGRGERRNSREEEGEEEDEEGGGEGASGLPSGDSTEDSEAARRAQKELEMEREEAAKWENVSSRWQTRLLAVECVRRLLAVLQDPNHFDLGQARESGAKPERYLIEMLQELVSVAFTAGTSPLEAVRPVGVVMLFDIADKFGQADDPDYEGKRLLELYSAQISAALRPCFAPEAEPALCAAGCAATSRYLLVVASSRNGHVVDPVAVRKLLGLLTKLASPDELGSNVSYPEYSESAATMVRAAALQATAQLMQAASAPDAPYYAELRTQLSPSLPSLRDCWLALLRDLALLDTQPKSARRSYRPHTYSPATARAAHPQLLQAWPTALSAIVATISSGGDEWSAGREGAISAIEEAAALDADPTAALGRPEGGKDGHGAEPLKRMRPHLESEDGAMLVGVCTHRLGIFAEAGGQVGDEEREEVLLALHCLEKLLPKLRPSALPPPSLLRLVQLLRACCLCAADSAVLAALAALIASLSAASAALLSEAPSQEAAPLAAPLAALAAAPLLRTLPHLQALVSASSPAAPAPPPPPSEPLPAEATPLVASSLRAIASMPTALADQTARLAAMPAAMLLAIHTCHAACVSADDALADSAATAARALLASVPEEGGAAVTCAALATTLELLDATPKARRSHLLSAALAAAAALPDESEAAAAPLLARLHAALSSNLGGEPAEQTVALGCLQAELQRASAAGGGAVPARVLAHLRAVLPDVAPLLLRSTPLERADKPSAIKLLLLACALSPPSALQPLLSLTLPLIINCLSLAADGPQGDEQRALTTLAHTSLTALAKRSPAEFRNAAAGFSNDTRTRMETALREQAAAASAPQMRAGAGSASAAAAPAAKPKIALTMNFGAFGK